MYVDDDADGVLATAPDADRVVQEDGYLSPARSLARSETPELSSPPQRIGHTVTMLVDDFAELMSSPEVDRTATPRRRRGRSESPLGGRGAGRVLVLDTPKRVRRGDEGPDLRDQFDDEDDDEGGAAALRGLLSTQTSTDGPDTPADEGGAGAGRALDVDYLDAELIDVDAEDMEMAAGRAREKIVAHGWWTKWARAGMGAGRGGKTDSGAKARSPLRRRETTVTPEGRHKAFRFRPHTAPGTSKAFASKGRTTPKGRASSRQSLAMVFGEGTAGKATSGADGPRNRFDVFRLGAP
ncbi:hypothetical protein FA95DRAFT_1557150 [Auriscalpium vulgare]|uniref:Uncharacterized protein n=1 Tax=Auriscalpium vulgare TaxID=40419 RepID=A0ACB8RYQ2_9AGAM|nr:hypothetical protein FA95DRAFT_1557150 [Auriscalpium vulgare]